MYSAPASEYVVGAKALSPMRLPVKEVRNKCPQKKKKGPCPHGNAVIRRQQGCDSEVLVVLCPIKLGACLSVHASEK